MPRLLTLEIPDDTPVRRLHELAELLQCRLLQTRSGDWVGDPRRPQDQAALLRPWRQEETQ